MVKRWSRIVVGVLHGLSLSCTSCASSAKGWTVRGVLTSTHVNPSHRSLLTRSMSAASMLSAQSLASSGSHRDLAGIPGDDLARIPEYCSPSSLPASRVAFKSPPACIDAAEAVTLKRRRDDASGQALIKSERCPSSPRSCSHPSFFPLHASCLFTSTDPVLRPQ